MPSDASVSSYEKYYTIVMHLSIQFARSSVLVWGTGLGLSFRYVYSYKFLDEVIFILYSSCLLFIIVSVIFDYFMCVKKCFFPCFSSSVFQLVINNLMCAFHDIFFRVCFLAYFLQFLIISIFVFTLKYFSMLVFSICSLTLNNFFVCIFFFPRTLSVLFYIVLSAFLYIKKYFFLCLIPSIFFFKK